MPAKGVNTRTVASSSHVNRPASVTIVGRCAETGSTLMAASCGAFVSMNTVSPEAFTADSAGSDFCEWHPTQKLDRTNRKIRICAFICLFLLGKFPWWQPAGQLEPRQRRRQLG